MKAILVAKLASTAPLTSPSTSSSNADAVPTKHPFQDLRTIVPNIIHRKHNKSVSNNFFGEITKLLSDCTGANGNIDIPVRSRKFFEVTVNNKAFFGEQQKAWHDFIKPLETKLNNASAEKYVNDFFVNLSNLATYNVKTPTSVLLFLFLKTNTYTDHVEQTMAAKCLGIPIHIYRNQVDKEGLPFQYKPNSDSSPHSLNIFYDFHGATSLANHFNPVFITEVGNNIPILVPVETLVDLGLFKSREDGETQRRLRRSNSHPADAASPFKKLDLTSLFHAFGFPNSIIATASSAASSSSSLPAIPSLQPLALPALPPSRQAKLPTAADLFGGANANELQSEGAGGDSKAEKEADKPSTDAVAMYILAKGDLYLANFVHPKGDVTYQVEGITNANVNWYQGTRK